MAFNVDNVRIVKSVGESPRHLAYMTVDDLKRLRQCLLDDMPEDCFLNDLRVEQAVDGSVDVTGIEWTGECSARSFDFFESDVVPAIKGEIVALVSWEHGEKTEIWHIKGGELSQLDMMSILKNPDVLQACLNYDRKE